MLRFQVTRTEWLLPELDDIHAVLEDGGGSSLVVALLDVEDERAEECWSLGGWV